MNTKHECPICGKPTSADDPSRSWASGFERRYHAACWAKMEKRCKAMAREFPRLRLPKKQEA